MGMYDELKCNMPLPPNGEVSTCVFQTKDLECSLSMYTITTEGRLVADDWHYEDTPEDKKPFPNSTGWRAAMGCVTRVVDKPNADRNFHGSVNFYGEGGDFIALFKDGTCIDLKNLEPPSQSGEV